MHVDCEWKWFYFLFGLSVHMQHFKFNKKGGRRVWELNFYNVPWIHFTFIPLFPPALLLLFFFVKTPCSQIKQKRRGMQYWVLCKFKLQTPFFSNFELLPVATTIRIQYCSFHTTMGSIMSIESYDGTTGILFLLTLAC